jgi:hypothetical protein
VSASLATCYPDQKQQVWLLNLSLGSKTQAPVIAATALLQWPTAQQRSRCVGTQVSAQYLLPLLPSLTLLFAYLAAAQ